MFRGFYHNSIGYWQTNSTITQDALKNHPTGTVEVGLPPTPNHTFDGLGWVEIVPTQRTSKEVDELRKTAYLYESDPIFFKWQRGEATKEEWLAKIDEIKARYI